MAAPLPKRQPPSLEGAYSSAKSQRWFVPSDRYGELAVCRQTYGIPRNDRTTQIADALRDLVIQRSASTSRSTSGAATPS